MGEPQEAGEWGRKAGRSPLGPGAIGTIVGLVLLVVFMVQNRDDVRVELLVWSFDWPLWLLILASAVVGAVVAAGLSAIRARRRRHAAKR